MLQPNKDNPAVFDSMVSDFLAESLDQVPDTGVASHLPVCDTYTSFYPEVENHLKRLCSDDYVSKSVKAHQARTFMSHLRKLYSLGTISMITPPSRASAAGENDKSQKRYLNAEVNQLLAGCFPNLVLLERARKRNISEAEAACRALEKKEEAPPPAPSIDASEAVKRFVDPEKGAVERRLMVAKALPPYFLPAAETTVRDYSLLEIFLPFIGSHVREALRPVLPESVDKNGLEDLIQQIRADLTVHKSCLPHRGQPKPPEAELAGQELCWFSMGQLKRLAKDFPLLCLNSIYFDILVFARKHSREGLVPDLGKHPLYCVKSLKDRGCPCKVCGSESTVTRLGKHLDRLKTALNPKNSEETDCSL